MRIGINGSGLLANPDLGILHADIEAAETEGLSSYWIAQTGMVDALTAIATSKTTAIEMGTAVIPTWTQHPMALAASALTTQAAINGRLILGIGLSHKPAVELSLHMKWEKPIRHMLDYLAVLDGLLTEGVVSHHGEIWSLDAETRRPTEQAPKVMLAALGDQMLRIAGKRTDGTILWCVGPKTIESHIAPKINEAASEAGRDKPAIVCSIPIWVTDAPAPAREFISQVLSVYAELPSYRAMLDIEGIHGLEDLSLVGTEDEIREGLATIAASGATDFTGVIMGSNPDETAAGRALLASMA